MAWRLQLPYWPRLGSSACPRQKERLGDPVRERPTEPSDGERLILPFLLGGSYQLYAHIQVRYRDGRVRYFVSPILSLGNHIR